MSTDRTSELFHLFGQHRRTIDFDDLQGRVNLMEFLRASFHQGPVIRLSLHVVRKGTTRLGNDLVQLTLDPRQGAVIAIISHMRPFLRQLGTGSLSSDAPRDYVYASE